MASRVPSKDVSKDTLLGSRESERSLVSRSWQTGIRREERYNYLIEFIRPTLVDLSRDDRFSLPTSRRHHCSSPNFRPIFFFLFLFFFFLLFSFVLHLSPNWSITNLKSGNLLLVIRFLVTVFIDLRVDDFENL